MVEHFLACREHSVLLPNPYDTQRQFASNQSRTDSLFLAKKALNIFFGVSRTVRFITEIRTTRNVTENTLEQKFKTLLNKILQRKKRMMPPRIDNSFEDVKLVFNAEFHNRTILKK